MKIPILHIAALFCIHHGSQAAQQVVESPRIQLRLDGYVAMAGYEEHPSIAPVDSEWDAPAVGVELALRREAASGLTLGGVFNAMQSAKAKEKWTSNGVPIQKNNMDVSMVDFRFEVGKVLATPGSSVSFHPSLGIGFQLFEFLRDDFVVDGTPANFGRVAEDYRLVYISTGVEMVHHWTPSSGMDLHALAGWIFMAEAENDLVAATIEGDGGFRLHGSAAWFLQPTETPTRRFKAGVSVDIQKLDGRVEDFVNIREGVPNFNTVEWPDNNWTMLSFFLSWSERF